MSIRILSTAALAAVALAAAPVAGVTLQAQVTTIGTPADPGFGYLGAFATAASGGTARYAQTFTAPTGGSALLQTFSFHLGDNNSDASGTGLLFRALVYTVSGTQLGTQLYASAPRTGSANYTAFDTYAFLPGIFLTPGVSTFAFVLEATGGAAGAQNVIATTSGDYAGGQLFAVDATGALVQPNAQDAYFSATFLVTPTSTVPEPTTVALVAGGLAALGAMARRRRTA